MSQTVVFGLGSLRSLPALGAFAVALAGALAVSGCDEESEPGPEPYEGPPLPWAYEPFPAVVHPSDNPSSSEKVELGRLLFYDPILSRDEATACATCHSEQWGMSDGLGVSIGVDGEGPTGPGRSGPNVATRNALTLWNAALRRELFWDGRAASLEEQALQPLEQALELDLDPEEAASRIAAIPAYVELFEAAFPGEAQPVTSDNVARALSTFERSLLSNRAPYDRYVDGDEGALSDEQLEGMQLFAEAGCATCHVPPLFESNRYAARVETDDEGRMAVTAAAADRGAFRVPTLRNLRESGPYFHDGSSETLEEAVWREADVAAREGEGRALTWAEVDLVALFLKKALMDRSREPERPDEVPSGLDVPLDGLRIPR
ncbi:MAG: cytochrome-c peroxidase [Polyangiaceae bacterium]|nr:cytochrome-c peroxidase [Polyangiaceae bacterium]